MASGKLGAMNHFPVCLLPVPGQGEKESDLIQLSKSGSPYYLEIYPSPHTGRPKPSQRDVTPEGESLGHRIRIFLRFLKHFVHFILASYVTKNLYGIEFSVTL